MNRLIVEVLQIKCKVDLRSNQKRKFCSILTEDAVTFLCLFISLRRPVTFFVQQLMFCVKFLDGSISTIPENVFKGFFFFRKKGSIQIFKLSSFLFLVSLFLLYVLFPPPSCDSLKANGEKAGQKKKCG